MYAFYVMSRDVSAVAHHREEDGEVVEVGEDLPDHRLQLHKEQSRAGSVQSRWKDEGDYCFF